MTRKKKIAIGAGAAVLVCALAVGGVFVFRHVQLEKYKAVPLDLPDGFTCTAHTGCMDTAENSLDSIDIAVKNGADVVEFDLNFTKDGEAVLAHDEPKGGEVTLEEAFKKVSTYNLLQVNVDVKSTANLPEVTRLAKKYGILDRIFYTGIEEEDVAAVKRDTPEVPYYLNLSVKKSDDTRHFIELAEKVHKSGAVGINCKHTNTSKEFVDFFRENGYRVSIWTAENEYDIYKLLSFSPDNITTTRPDLLNQITQEKSQA